MCALEKCPARRSVCLSYERSFWMTEDCGPVSVPKHAITHRLLVLQFQSTQNTLRLPGAPWCTGTESAAYILWAIGLRTRRPRSIDERLCEPNQRAGSSIGVLLRWKRRSWRWGRWWCMESEEVGHRGLRRRWVEDVHEGGPAMWTA